MGGLSFFIKKIKKIIDKHTEKDYNQLVKLRKRSTKEVQNMKWIVTKFIGTGFDIRKMEQEVQEFDYEDSDKAYALKDEWKKEKGVAEVWVALV